MSSEKKQQAPFFILFPWFKVAAGLFLILLGMMAVYRLSEAGGTRTTHACLAAMIVAGTAGISGLYIIAKMWGRDGYWVLVGVMGALVIRPLISGASFAIIIPFTKIDKSWYIFFLAVYYIAFLVIDTWFALWILRHSELKINEQKETVHGNLWDIIR